MAFPRLAVYYHMPCHIGGDRLIHANPVMGTFVEALAEHFSSVVLISPELDVPNPSASYLVATDRVRFVGLGPVGRYWDHFQRMRRIQRAVERTRDMWDILLLRAPSPRAYAVWKCSGRPERTALLFVGNVKPQWHSNYGPLWGLFLRARATWFARALGRICAGPQRLVMANSPSLQRYWQKRSATAVELVHTSSLSAADVVQGEALARFRRKPIRLLFVGRVCLDKGIKELLRALFVLNDGPEAPYVLDIVGPPADLGEASLSDLVREAGVVGAVNYHGVVPFGLQLFAFYRQADAYVLPSYHEGMPKTVWEAMAQGTPVIATDVGGMGDLFEDGREVVFVKPGSHESIVRGVLRLKDDPELRDALARRGLERAASVTREAQAERIACLMRERWGAETVRCERKPCAALPA